MPVWQAGATCLGVCLRREFVKNDVIVASLENLRAEFVESPALSPVKDAPPVRFPGGKECYHGSAVP